MNEEPSFELKGVPSNAIVHIAIPQEPSLHRLATLFWYSKRKKQFVPLCQFVCGLSRGWPKILHVVYPFGIAVLEVGVAEAVQQAQAEMSPKECRGTRRCAAEHEGRFHSLS